MSNESEPVVNAVESVRRVPPSGKQFPTVRHLQAENNASTWLFSALSMDIAAQVVDFLHKTPEKNSYDIFKRTVTSHLSDFQEKYRQQLYLQVELGDRTPSQLLQRM
ncbi:unnamed protein product [Hymenolepis diminuta]|uniref:Uncharacterized protein n=1 Tax=Hymenolepis diminuta TaxID=6216 RepID=A0A564ZCM9_HYMDI|nr:unnamed protein product [Hymenolepis diminuta]